MSLNSQLYTNNFKTFEQWLELVINQKEVYPQFRIPYDEWCESYIANISKKSVQEVKALLRVLLLPINRKLDIHGYIAIKKALQGNSDPEFQKMFDANEMYRRLELGHHAWEGITWILELLPYNPYQAVVALEGYSYSQQGLPDDRIIGLQQCIDIIYAKFIYVDKPKQILFNLSPTEFEWLIEKLYSRIGYETQWTPRTRDGGKDIIAKIKRPDGEEKVYIECKLYKTTELTNTYVKSFAYTVTDDKINRGVIFCTGYVNKSLEKIDKRITILNFDNIILLLNAHLGSDWDDRLPQILNSRKLKRSTKKTV